MLELREALAAVVQVVAAARALDALEAALPDAFAARIAPDEILLLGPREAATTYVAAARRHLTAADPGGLVVDQTDGWGVFTLGGTDAERLFRHLSALPLPRTRPALLQGGFAQVPTKALFLSDAVHIFVASPVAHHVRQRIETLGAELGINVLEAAPLELATRPVAPTP